LPDQAVQKPVLIVYAVFDHPMDYPTEFIVRRQLVYPGRFTIEPDVWCHAQSLEAARASIPSGLVRLPHQPQDPPFLTESWL